MVRHMAQHGKIPGRQVNGQWTFDREALTAAVPAEAEAMRAHDRLRVANRNRNAPSNRDDNLGFRCVAAPPGKTRSQARLPAPP